MTVNAGTEGKHEGNLTNFKVKKRSFYKPYPGACSIFRSSGLSQKSNNTQLALQFYQVILVLKVS